jgi:hypothetical protein
MIVAAAAVAAADEQFNYSKQTGFKGDGLAAIAVAFTQTTAVSTLPRLMCLPQGMQYAATESAVHGNLQCGW